MSELPRPEEPITSSESPPTIEERIKELRVQVESHQGLAHSIREEIKKDIGKMWDMVIVLGLEDAERVDRQKLTKLWEDRNMDEAAVVDLYWHIHAGKKKIYGSKSCEPIRLGDFLDAAPKEMPLQLRHDQTETSVDILRALGFEKGDIERRFQKGSEKHVQGLRLVAWLTPQEYMEDFREKISDRIDAAGTITSSELFATATAEVEWQILSHINNKNDDYDTTIGYEVDAYQRKNQELKTALILSRHIFFGEDISKYAQRDREDTSQ